MATTKVLIAQADIQGRIATLAAEIEREYPAGDSIHLVAILKGGFMFMADLVRAMSERVTMDFMAVSSYGKGTTSTGQVRVLKDLDSNVEGRHVILVEDIVDTGLTLHYLQDLLKARAPKSLKTACLLSKPSRRKVEVQVDYIGFTIEDHFVVGYGLDYAEKYRNLPYIAVWHQCRESSTSPRRPTPGRSSGERRSNWPRAATSRRSRPTRCASVESPWCRRAPSIRPPPPTPPP